MSETGRGKETGIETVIKSERETGIETVNPETEMTRNLTEIWQEKKRKKKNPRKGKNKKGKREKKKLLIRFVVYFLWYTRGDSKVLGLVGVGRGSVSFKLLFEGF